MVDSAEILLKNKLTDFGVQTFFIYFFSFFFCLTMGMMAASWRVLMTDEQTSG